MASEQARLRTEEWRYFNNYQGIRRGAQFPSTSALRSRVIRGSHRCSAYSCRRASIGSTRIALRVGT